VFVVVEYPERCEIAVNGRRVAYDGLPFWRDVRWLPIDISVAMIAGENTVELQYPSFRHQGVRPDVVVEEQQPQNTEIEAIYVIGDFHVAVQVAGDLLTAQRLPLPAWALPTAPDPTPPWNLRAVEGPFTLCAPGLLAASDLVDQGLPVFAGRVLARIMWPTAPAHRVWLEVEQLSVPVADVRVNGERAGTLAWRPYRVDVTNHLRVGLNTIEIILYHSLRNLLGPHHDAYGERYRVGPESFAPEYPGWARRMLQDGTADGWRPSYAVTPFGLLGSVYLTHAGEREPTACTASGCGAPARS
jgi:hypothetical protein